MTLIAGKSVDYWKQSKLNHWSLDPTTLRHLRDDIFLGIYLHNEIAKKISNETARNDFKATFAKELSEAMTAHEEIDAALFATVRAEEKTNEEKTNEEKTNEEKTNEEKTNEEKTNQ